MGRRTFAQGEPPKPGGGTPRLVVEVNLDNPVVARVLYTETGATLKAGDIVELETISGVELLELVKRRLGRAGWREVTREEPWWDGREVVFPVE